MEGGSAIMTPYRYLFHGAPGVKFQRNTMALNVLTVLHPDVTKDYKVKLCVSEKSI